MASKTEFVPTKEELASIEKAMKDETFRKLLLEYAQELQDPDNRKRYEDEITQLEAAQGNNVKFVNPEPGFVIKTKLVNSDMKAFLNICQSDVIDKPIATHTERDGKRGTTWSVPHSTSAHREDRDKSNQLCIVYDVVFHPQALRLATQDPKFKQMIVNTALEGVEQRFPDHKFDRNAVKFPTMTFKGNQRSTMIRTPAGEKQPINTQHPPPPAIETFANEFLQEQNARKVGTDAAGASKPAAQQAPKTPATQTPQHTITYRKQFDLQEYRDSRDSHVDASTPKEIVVAIDLPLCESASGVDLDITERGLTLHCEKPGPYHLVLKFSHQVSEEEGTAKFDKSKRRLVITLPVIAPKVDIAPTPSLVAEAQPEEETETSSDANELDGVESTETTQSTPKRVVDVPKQLPKFSSTQTRETVSVILHVPNIISSTVSQTFDQQDFGPVQTHSCGLKFDARGENDQSVSYDIIVKFDAALVCDQCSFDVSDSNIVFVFVKAEPLLWHRFRIGVSNTTLVEETFLTPQNIASLCNEASANDAWTQQTSASKDDAHVAQRSATETVVEITPAGPQPPVLQQVSVPPSILKTASKVTPAPTQSVQPSAPIPAPTPTQSLDDVPAPIPATTPVQTPTAVATAAQAQDSSLDVSASENTPKGVKFSETVDYSHAQPTNTQADVPAVSFKPSDVTPSWLQSSSIIYDLE